MSKVLILEDDEGLRFTLAVALEAAGHEVNAVGSVSQAIEMIGSVAFDVLLLDLMIQGKVSLTVADFAGYAAPRAKVVYITGTNLFPRGELFDMSNNASWVLRKPVKIEDLTEVINYIDKGADSARLATA